MLGMVKSIYELTRIEVITEEGITESFRNTKVVRQGCSLSPTLFRVFIDDLDDRWERNNEGGTVIGKKDLWTQICRRCSNGGRYGRRFAKLLEDLEMYAKENGMEVNTKKT